MAESFEATVHKLMSTDKDIASTADQLRKIIAAKPVNYFYRDYDGVTDQVEAGERQAFSSTAGGKDVAAQILSAFAGKIPLGELATNKQKATSYSKPNAPPLDGGSPGQSDGSGDLIPRLLLFNSAATIGVDKTMHSFAATNFPALPNQLATVTDILSTFQQAEQNMAQVDGSVKSPVFRNVAATLAVAGDPTLVNIRNADVTATFIAHLPPPAWPFAIDAKMASRGKEIFAANCAACHKPDNDNLYPVDLIGTDPNRSKVLNADALALFLKYFIASVPPDYEITDSTGTKVRLHDLPADSVLIPRTVLRRPIRDMWRIVSLASGRARLSSTTAQFRRFITFWFRLSARRNSCGAPSATMRLRSVISGNLIDKLAALIGTPIRQCRAFSIPHGIVHPPGTQTRT